MPAVEAAGRFVMSRITVPNIVSNHDRPRRLPSIRYAGDPNWALVVVTDVGRIKQIAFHPQGNSSPHIECECIEESDGTFLVGTPQLTSSARALGWKCLEDYYIEEQRRSGRDKNGKKNPAKTWTAYLAFQRLKAAGRLPKVRDSGGTPVAQHFPGDCLPDAVLELQANQGAVTPEEAAKALAELGDPDSDPYAKDDGDGRMEEEAILAEVNKARRR